MAEDNVFRATEAGDSTSPEFLKSEKDRPTEPEWHLKNMEKNGCLNPNSIVEISLDDEMTKNSGQSSDSDQETAVGEVKQSPVDLTPAEISAPAATATQPVVTNPAPPSVDSPRLSGAEVDEKTKTPQKPALSDVSATENSTSDRDLRLAACPPTDGSVSETAVDSSQSKTLKLTGMAVSDGKMLQFPGGAQFTSGDIIQCKDRYYRVKLHTGYPPVFYMKAVGLLALVLLAAIGISSLLGGPSTGSLTGVVIDSGTGRVISDAQVTLPDGTTATTTTAGLFTFPDLTPGDYQATVSMAGYNSGTITITRSEQHDVVLAIALDPIFAAVEKKKEKKSEPEEAKAPAKKIEYGALKLDIDFDNYIVYLDGKIYGKSIKKISKISPGKHEVMLEKNQYQEYRTIVSIQARRTTTLKIALEDMKRKTTARQRAKERFAEGRTALDNDYYPAAVKAFDAALAEVSEYPEALQYRGWAFRKLGNSENATRDFKTAAELYALANRHLDAVACANLLIEMYPKHGAYYIMRGNYQTALGELNPAIEDFKSAVDTDGDSLPFRLALAEGYYRNKQFKEAAKTFDRARKMTTDPADIYVRLILSYMYAGKDKDMVKRYRELADLATPEKMEKLRRDPEWQSVLQIVGPDEKYKEH